MTKIKYETEMYLYLKSSWFLILMHLLLTPYLTMSATYHSDCPDTYTWTLTSSSLASKEAKIPSSNS